MSGNHNNHLDIDFIRSCFPAFAEPLAAKTAFFENAGGSYVAGPVLDKLTHFYRSNKVQPYGYCEIAKNAGKQMDAGRQTMADLLGVPSQTITLGPSTTQNFNTLAHACSRLISSDTEVIVTEQDHESNIGAWERLCQRNKATLRLWPVDAATGELHISDFENLLAKSTAIVCLTHSSNIVGTINPVEEVVRLCRQNGTRVIVDGVSCAPHQWPDIPALKPDAYCFSTYKTYATHLGVMYIAEDFAQYLDPQCHYFNQPFAQKRFDAAGPDHAAIAALDGLGEYFSNSYAHHLGDANTSLFLKTQKVSALMKAHESDLCAQLLDTITRLPLRVIGNTHHNGREANIAMVSEKHSSRAMSEMLASKDICAGHGHFYAMRLLKKAGIKDTDDGVLRVSFSHYNSSEDVERLAQALNDLHQ
ncbi:hypothetical protein AB833_16555 [Chromatiales bacterium (ex Bugula neritina AB1)]|nr:hypothetical protein AB833_16555 [Chromatiales bacterium (ex Bugula neritina AB1)]